MLRVEIDNSASTVRLKFDGRFTSVDAQNTRTLVNHCFDRLTLLVDITDVTFIDSAGEDVLSFFGRLGAEFIADTSYLLDMCERLHLRLAAGAEADAKPPGTSPENGRRRGR